MSRHCQHTSCSSQLRPHVGALLRVLATVHLRAFLGASKGGRKEGKKNLFPQPNSSWKHQMVQTSSRTAREKAYKAAKWRGCICCWNEMNKVLFCFGVSLLGDGGFDWNPKWEKLQLLPHCLGSAQSGEGTVGSCWTPGELQHRWNPSRCSRKTFRL